MGNHLPLAYITFIFVFLTFALHPLLLQLALVKGESYSTCSRPVDQQVPFQLVAGVPEMLSLVEAISKEQLATAAAATAAADKAAAGVPPPRPPPGGPPSAAAGTAGAGPTAAAAAADGGAVPPPRPPPGTPPKAAAAADTNAEGTRVVSPAQRTDEATNAEMSNAEGSQRAGDVMQLTAAYSSRGRAAAGTGAVTA